MIKNMTFGAGDYILFRDGIQDDSPQIAKYAHCAYGTLRLYSTGRYMLVNFVSDASSLGTGFQLDFESLDSSRCMQIKLYRGRRGWRSLEGSLDFEKIGRENQS